MVYPLLNVSLGKIVRTLGMINKIGPQAMEMLRLDNDAFGNKTIFTEAVLNNLTGDTFPNNFFLKLYYYSE